MANRGTHYHDMDTGFPWIKSTEASTNGWLPVVVAGANGNLTVTGSHEADNWTLKLQPPAGGSDYTSLTLWGNGGNVANRNWRAIANITPGVLRFDQSTTTNGSPNTARATLSATGLDVVNGLVVGETSTLKGAVTADSLTVTNATALQGAVTSHSLVVTNNLGIGTASPTARLHLPAGTATASTAPLKIASGVLNTTAETGAIEYDGTSLSFTRTGTVRETVPTVVTKTDTGDGTGAEGLFQINTFDNTFKVYADGAWRSLATW
jgi:hypothetical protein